MSRILVVEDEAHIAEGLRFNLEAEGHSVELAASGEEATDLLTQSGPFDAVILDVMLPGKDGFHLTRELRQNRNFVPVLMLTARGRPEDVLKGFESGADDYLPKPFNLAILMARVGSLLRRGQWQHGLGTPPADNGGELFRFADRTIDFGKLLISSPTQSFQLTLMESELLRYLVRNSGRPVSRKEILEQVWDLHEDTDTRAIDNFIVRLRRYVEPEPSRPRYLLTVRGLGYEFNPNPN